MGIVIEAIWYKILHSVHGYPEDHRARLCVRFGSDEVRFQVFGIHLLQDPESDSPSYRVAFPSVPVQGPGSKIERSSLIEVNESFMDKILLPEVLRGWKAVQDVVGLDRNQTMFVWQVHQKKVRPAKDFPYKDSKKEVARAS